MTLMTDWMLNAANEIVVGVRDAQWVRSVIAKHSPMKEGVAYVEVGEEWLTPSQAAHRMGVSRRTIYNWMEDSKLIFKQTAGGTRRILASSMWKK